MPGAGDKGAKDETDDRWNDGGPGRPAQGSSFLVNGVEGCAAGVVAEAEQHQADGS